LWDQYNDGRRIRKENTMMNFIFGIVIAILLISYNSEIRLISIETGVRDMMVEN